MTNSIAPYCMTNDNIIMMMFIMNIIAVSYIFLMNGAGIIERVKAFFYYENKTTPFSNRTHITTVCNVLLYIQTLFYSTIIASRFMLEKNIYQERSTILTLMAIFVLLFAAVLLFKLVGYHIANTILFEKQQAEEWRDFYFFTIKLLGFALTPAVITALFIPEIPTVFVKIYLLIVLVIYLYTILNGLIKIIFIKRRNYLDIFLYLCALEFLPMGVVWKSVLQVSEFLTIKN